MHRAPSIRLLVVAFSISLAGCGGCRFLRSDDSLEDNDDAAHATPLTIGETKQGTVWQDDDDAFAIEMPAGKTLVLRIASENPGRYASFTLLAPDGATLYSDGTFLGPRPSTPKVCVEDVSCVAIDGEEKGYELRAKCNAPGRYVVVIDERPERDNAFDFHWDYSIRASTEMGE